MKVTDLMTAAVHVCHPEDTLAQAAQRLWEHDCGALPVVDPEGRVLGVVTDRDLLMGTHLSGRPLAGIAVAETMSLPARTVRVDADLEEAAEVLAAGRLHRLPVVDAEERLAGILTLADLAGAAERPKSARARQALAERVLATFAAVHTARVAPAEREVELTPAAPAAEPAAAPARKAAPRKTAKAKTAKTATAGTARKKSTTRPRKR